MQRRLAWPLRKDDAQIREAFHIFKEKKKKPALNREYDAADSRKSSGMVKPCGSSQYPLFLGCIVPRGLGPRWWMLRLLQSYYNPRNNYIITNKNSAEFLQGQTAATGLLD